VWIAIALSAALALPLGAAETDEGGSLSPNVLLTITVKDGDGSEERSYRVLARGNNSRARLLTGWRVPIPTTTSGAQGKGGSTTTYSYQNVGLTAELWARVPLEDQVVLRGEIEISGAREAIRNDAGGPVAPMIGTFEQSFNVLLREGTPLELAEVAKPEGGPLSVRLQADILD
jgi:hypothetical protein